MAQGGKGETMKREEAIKMIQDDMRLHHDYLSGKYRKALRMAIEALQREDRLLKSLETNEPIYDMVDVVRCKDCKHKYMDGEVTHYYWCRLHDRPVDDTDYCSWGEESEVEE